jgi:hypothetical protein
MLSQFEIASSDEDEVASAASRAAVRAHTSSAPEGAPIAPKKWCDRPPRSKNKPKAARNTLLIASEQAEKPQVEQAAAAKEARAKRAIAKNTTPAMTSTTATSVAAQEDGGDAGRRSPTKKRQVTRLPGPPPPAKVTRSGRTVKATAKAVELAAQKAAE